MEEFDLEGEIAAAGERSGRLLQRPDPRPTCMTAEELEAALVEDLGIDLRTALAIHVTDAGHTRGFFTYKGRHWELVLVSAGKHRSWNLTPSGRQMILGVPGWQLRERLLAELSVGR